MYNKSYFTKEKNLKTNRHVYTQYGFEVGIIFLVVVGSIMQGYANKTIDSIVVAAAFFCAGIVIVKLIFRKKHELDGFMLTYGICVFIGGVAQCYSTVFFDGPQSTIDSFTFYNAISKEPPFRTLGSLPKINSPLAILIWQQAYKVTYWLGMKFGPYTAVILNAFVMGLSWALTVKTARELFGNDSWRLNRTVYLFSFCGLFILFGSVILRDCFTTFVNLLILWSIVHWLVKPKVEKIFVIIFVYSISTIMMLYLRGQTVLLFGFYGFLGFIYWSFGRTFSTGRVIVLLVILVVALIYGSQLKAFFKNSQSVQEKGMENYATFASSANNVHQSLGARFVVNQPLPIRLILGSGSLMISPIPLWNNFKIGYPEYHLIKGYHGVYQIFVIPLVIYGFFIILKEFRKSAKILHLSFLVIYLMLNLVAVVLTSLEQRHLAQYLPAFIILASVADTRESQVKKAVKVISSWWFGIVISVHLLWIVMKVNN